MLIADKAFKSLSITMYRGAYCTHLHRQIT